MSPSAYHPYAWPGAAHRASDPELTVFGLLALFSFVSCGALWLTHLWVRDWAGSRTACWRARFAAERWWRRRRSRDETTEKDEDEEQHQVVPPPVGDLPWADRSTLNLLAICCISSVPWSFLYLDHPSTATTSSAYARTGAGSPTYAVCLTQGSYVLSWCVFLSAGALGVMVKMWTRIALIDRRLVPWRMPLGVEIASLAYPWIAMLAVTLAALVEGARHPQMVLIGQYYCWVASARIQKAALAISVAHLIIVLALEVHLCVFIRQHFVKLRQAAAEANNGGLHTQQNAGGSRGSATLGGLRLSVIVRPMWFGLLSIISLGMATVVLVVDRTAPWGKIVLGCCPPMAFFAYASDRHILKQWRLDRLWRYMRGKSSSQTRLPPSGSTSPTSSWKSSKYIPGLAVLSYADDSDPQSTHDLEKNGGFAAPHPSPAIPGPTLSAAGESPTRSRVHHMQRMYQWQEALDAYHRRWLEQGPLVQLPPPTASKE